MPLTDGLGGEEERALERGRVDIVDDFLGNHFVDKDAFAEKRKKIIRRN